MSIRQFSRFERDTASHELEGAIVGLPQGRCRDFTGHHGLKRFMTVSFWFIAASSIKIRDFFKVIC